MASEVAGYIGTLIAVLFFGSNYVPTRNYAMGPGIAFQFLLSIGILCIGYLSLPFADPILFYPAGILGGSLWALGNELVVPIIQCIGLGLGLLTWSVANLATGYIIGKTGLFGVDKEASQSEALNIIGFLFAVSSLVCYLLMDPRAKENKVSKTPVQTLPDDKFIQLYATGAGQGEEDEEARTPLQSKVDFGPSHSSSVSNSNSSSSGSIQHQQTQSVNHKKGMKTHTASKENEGEEEKEGGAKRGIAAKLFGFGMALVAGILYACSMVPYKLWQKDHSDLPPMAFAFSHYSGIFILSTAVFLGYAVVQRVRKQPVWLYNGMSFPSICSGAMWGIAQCGLFYSLGSLGFSVGFVMTSVGPCVVSSLWAYFYFGEMRGRRNVALLLTSFALTFVGVTMIVLSKEV
jgi:glucose uptake protein GlcU